jgi:MFS family permease
VAESTIPAEATATAPPDTQPAVLLFGSRAMHRMLAAFTYRDFRVQWFGACTSSVGTWTQSAAQNWMVPALAAQALKNPALYLGLDAFLQQLPIILFTLVGGVLADRRDRRRTLLASQYLQMTTATILALLVYFGVVKLWHVLLLSFATGVAQSFGGPAYQALIPQLVASKDLPNAIAFNSIQVNIARVIGPLVFGATVSVFAVWGYTYDHAMAACFAINALSFLVVVYTLMSLHVKHIAPAATNPIGEEMRTGLSYVRNNGTLLALTLLAGLTTFLGFAVLTFLPLFTKAVFNEGAGTYSHLLAFSGAGSIVGALVVAWLGKYKRMGLTALLLQAVYGILIVAFSWSRTLWLSDVLLFLTGGALMVVFSSITSLVQLIAPNQMRGRVMSIYMLAFRGGMPLGSLMSGWAAAYITAPMVLEINGALLVVVAIYFLVRGYGIREL